ncbi:hypothetical protein FNV43_RR04362 [Rhamnella rubrinervis]|uniref:Uncharacterized protein n=1 Tax=Rhamnella rubrinervis TaxID=2594499 RepID=A0A8K0MPH7_9ROSA|nr:hypothetical protein FNV43_RR04362 [Rhamnella rubrinervis]
MTYTRSSSIQWVGARFDRKAFAMFLVKAWYFRDQSRLVKKNNFTIIENDNLLEKYPWGTYAMILRFRSPSKMEGKQHPTDLYWIPLAFW